MSARSDPNAERRAAILDAATPVFLRYGYKKTSMDDLARAAGLSRQGLYLHFPTKEALFEAGLLRLLATTRAAGRAALARTDLSVAERALEMFVAMHGHAVGEASSEHLDELVRAAKRLGGSATEALEREQVGDLARLFRSEGVAEAWKAAGLSATALAEHLVATSLGIKHSAANQAQYREGMRVALQIVCRGHASPRRR